MSEKLFLKTRREFLRSTLLGGALTWTVPSFLAQTFDALRAQAADSALQTATGKDQSILVVLQMAGGNDGLNTVVPIGNDHYHRARPTLGLADKEILKLTDEIGLHGSLTGFKALSESGHLAIIQGVGYPNPNRSHFRSTEIWQTASDSQQVERCGWLGRYFDNACTGADPAIGISLGPQRPQAFASRTPRGISLINPQNYRFSTADEHARNAMNSSEKFFRLLNDIPSPAEIDHDINSGSSVAALSGQTHSTLSPLDYLERVTLEAEVSSDRILAISRRGTNQAQYPGGPLANSLKMVARLIAGGMPTRVYYVSQGGYDTHTNQRPAQQRLLKELGDSLQAFVQDIKAQGNLSRVLVMTFSEFGRRVAQNANGGTDHGAAAPMFVVGEKVRGNLLGRYPSLAPADLFNGDIRYTVDFRAVYADILDQWLKAPSEKILGRKFEPLAAV